LPLKQTFLTTSGFSENFQPVMALFSHAMLDGLFEQL
jgi:hypothetical protein